MDNNSRTLLSHNEICELLEQGVVVGASMDMVNAASLDLTLGPELLVESPRDGRAVDLSDPDTNPMDVKFKLRPGDDYYLSPGEFVLGHTKQVFNLPTNISAMFMLKSTMARNGLNHHNAGWCDAGWSGSALTLEFKNDLNNHVIILREGMKCGQMIFFRHTEVPEDKSYRVRGSYNGDGSVQSSKGLR